MPDCRNIKTGLPVPGELYADQPYVVQTDDGAWLMVMTTGSGHEGERGQHIKSMRSTDCGQTWTDIGGPEPSDGPEASYAVLLKTPYGRIYCFYNHNTDNVREVRLHDGTTSRRVDSLGHYVFKYSDDNGKSWSAERYDVPVRDFDIDIENPYHGSLRFFWNVGRPLVLENEVLLTLHKICSMTFARTEGCILRSPNILTERDPTKIRFETLPDGTIGLRAPEGGGSVAEEHCLNVLSDGSLICVYRTADGSPAVSYSRDRALTWTAPEYLTDRPGGRIIKHPRAANFLWSCGNGQFLYWFHNHGGPVVLKDPSWDHWWGRNPVWLAAAREIDTPQGIRLEFSQPEILLYDDDPYTGISYPDLIQKDGQFWVTETQKTVGRVHKIAPQLLEGLFAQWDSAEVAQDLLLLEHKGTDCSEPDMPVLPDFSIRDYSSPSQPGKDMRTGFTLEFTLSLSSLSGGQILLDSRKPDGRGVCVLTTENKSVGIVLSDAMSESSWEADPNILTTEEATHVVFVVDGGPKVISVLVNGVMCDGGEHREYGWGWFSPYLRNVTGGPKLRVNEQVKTLRIYGRALRTSEAVANYRAEFGK